MTDPTATSPSSGTTSAPIVPDWLINLAALGWRVLAVAGLLIVLWFVLTMLWTVTASIAVAVVVSAVFAPYVLRLRARGRTRTSAALIVWAVAILVITGVLLLLAIAFLPYVVDLASNIVAGVTDLQARLAEIQVPPIVGTVAKDVVEAALGAAGDAAGGIVASAAQVVTIAILATFLVFFLLRDGDKAWVWSFQAVGEQKRDRITTAGADALARVGGYLRGTTVLSGLVAITDYLFMLLLGVPLALPLAVLVFLAGYIPYFGGIVTTGIILLVTLAALGPVPALVLLVLIGIRNVILGYLVRPAVYGRTVSIHPALVLIVLPAGYELAGVIGLFAAVPVTAVVLAVASATVAIVDPDPRPQLPGLVPAWLDRVAQWSWRILIGLALVALAVGVFLAIPLVAIPVVVALIIAATLEPLVQALIRRGRSRTRAAGIAVGGGFLLIVVVLVLAFVAVVDQASELGSGTTSGADSVNQALGGQAGLGVQAVGQGTAEALRTIATLAGDVATLAVIAVLSVLLGFYFLKDGGQLWSRLISRTSPDSRPEVDTAGTRAFDVLGGYMVGTAAISFVGAASQFLIMVILGIPLAFPVFVLSFILCFIPYIGGFISTGIAFLLTVAFGSTADIVIMGIWTIVFNIVQGNVVSPLVYGRTVHIHPAIVLLAIPAAAAVAGIMGMFIVVPALGVIAATWRTVLGVMSAHAGASVAVGSPAASVASKVASAPGSTPASAPG